ncbi:MAG TPA: glutathione S-transferase C-terminal domain-containing protein [Casimicrobiaceae bacterium]|nr:glutathione S-transferase C-terminal domain-containing protein [Casimicrobiaceae bacterium]
MTLMIAELIITRVPGGAQSAAGARVLERMKQMLAFIDDRLASAAYFAGEAFTAADIMMTFPFTTMRRFLAYDLAPYRHIVAYLDRIGSRAAYRKAMSLAGPEFSQ